MEINGFILFEKWQTSRGMKSEWGDSWNWGTLASFREFSESFTDSFGIDQNIGSGPGLDFLINWIFFIIDLSGDPGVQPLRQRLLQFNVI